ncbi:MAG: zinc-binding alcohol dehydrogenase family protein [Cyclobacteriaceae bacterium]|nr:zinc-binding alcohol dehydrogenase family protein [Cyclobacteriaceae bacterium]MDH4298341.1 zinc-binding alcohol dehydrogenase family protein [Cyclobacteriaceae bacterium]MDH5250780.1 zinc-binding alcohol dehydrogenase family protein [Cyclobacteriaceae bacterium]
MKYIVCDNPGHFSVQSKDAPILTDGNTLLRVKRVGICGTDLHAYKGNQPFFSYPRILGHELAAEVLEVGSNQSQLKTGDKVVIMPYINCGVCVACKAGKSNCCQDLKVFGVHVDGGMQEIILLPTRLLLPANDLSLEEIAIVEPLAIGAHAVRRAGTKKGDTIVVMGCGPIGIGIIQFAKYIGATVIVVDINDHRLNIVSEQFQADVVVNALHAPMEKIKEYTNGDLAHTVFDATGSKLAIEAGPNYMRHGGSFILVGLFKGELAFQHPALHAKEASLLCSRNATLEDFEFVMKVLREGKFNTHAYITRRANFEAILTDFDGWASADSKEIKVVTVL